ncbi:3-hydroxyacyl-CoA dehydrogenase [Actibacterium sp. D379-3]
MGTVAKDFTIGIVGAGVMGRGIAQIAVEAGYPVILADISASAAQDGVEFCTGMIRRQADKGRTTPEAAAGAIALLRPATVADADSYGVFAGCALVIEVVAERMDIKHAVLAQLEDAVAESCIIATNTSSFSVTEFAAPARLPNRIAGFHFFNPVPLMKIVEVIGGALTDPDILATLSAVAARMGHFSVKVTDSPGFLINHAGRAYVTEALRILSEGICDVADLDRIMTGAAGFRMGPFELLDLTGLDVSQGVMESIYHQFYEEPRFRPSAIAAKRRAAGLFGRKTGRGFYSYEKGKPHLPEEPPAPQIDVAGAKIWVSNAHPEYAAALRGFLAGIEAQVETGGRPSDQAIAFFTPLGQDTTTSAMAEGVDPKRAVAVDMLLGLAGHRTLMRTPVTDADVLARAYAMLAADGGKVTAIHDSAGFVAQRMLACIANVGTDIAQQRIAAPGDIDRAVELGLGYPSGPLKLGDTLGAGRVLAILEGCQHFYGDPRYRPSPWLKRRALLGVSLTVDEG